MAFSPTEDIIGDASSYSGIGVLSSIQGSIDVYLVVLRWTICTPLQSLFFFDKFFVLRDLRGLFYVHSGRVSQNKNAKKIFLVTPFLFFKILIFYSWNNKIHFSLLSPVTFLEILIAYWGWPIKTRFFSSIFRQFFNIVAKFVLKSSFFFAYSR